MCGGPKGMHTVHALGGEPWFVARDVAVVLGYANPNDTISRHCKGVAFHDTPTSSGIQIVRLIPERDVYWLVMCKLNQGEGGVGVPSYFNLQISANQSLFRWRAAQRLP